MPTISKKQFNSLVSISHTQKEKIILQEQMKNSYNFLLKDHKIDIPGMEKIQDNSIFFKFRQAPNYNAPKTFPLLLFIKGGVKKLRHLVQDDLLLIGNIIQHLNINIVAGIEFQKPFTVDDCLVVHFKGFPSYMMQQKDNRELKLSYVIKIAKAMLKIEDALSYCESQYRAPAIFNVNNINPTNSNIHSVFSKYFLIDSEEYLTDYLSQIKKIFEFRVTLTTISNFIDDVKNEFSFFPTYSKKERIEAADALYDMVIEAAYKDKKFELCANELLKQFPVLNSSSMRNLLSTWEEEMHAKTFSHAPNIC